MDFELGLKVRPFELDCTSIEFGNQYGNAVEFEKIDTGGRLNLYVDRDIYLTEKGYKGFKKMIFDHIREPVTPALIETIEGEYINFFKMCFASNDIEFKKPVIFETAINFSFDGVTCENQIVDTKPEPLPQFFKIPAEYFFNYY